MSRKPPKLVPIPPLGKDGSLSTPTTESEGSSCETKPISEGMPPLKPGINLNTIPTTTAVNVNNSSGGLAAPSLRRSGLTRNFLNCNGSAAKGRFSTKLSSSPSTPNSTTTASLATLSSSLKGKGGTSTTNGCGGEESSLLASPLLNKVNGTVSNGISAKSNDSRIKRRRESLQSGGEEEDESSSTSDSQQSVVTNGNKVENNSSLSIPCNNTGSSDSISANINNSQRVINNVVNNNNNHHNNVLTRKRTSNRFSQNKFISRKVFTPSVTTATTPSCLSSRSSSPSSVIAEDKEGSSNNVMPALVAFDYATIEKDNALLDQSLSPHYPDEKLDCVLDSVDDVEVDAEGVNQSRTSTAESISEEPKIIRKGDTVIKSYVDEKTGRISVFEKEMKLEVCDFGSGKWYPAKVKNIDWTEQNILVHYSNWSSRYDEWISMTSNRVRPSKNTNVVSYQFSVGERVEAVWPSDSKQYMATVTQSLNQDTYEVLFDDGIKMKRGANQLRKVSTDILELPVPSTPPSSLSVQTEMDSPATEGSEIKPRIDSRSTRKRRSWKNSNIKEQINQPPQPPPKTTSDQSELTPEPPLSSDTSITIPNSRPTHFSMFDLPKGDLGKRKRTVHDYSVLVKGKSVVKGPRRPKSEGANVSIDESNLSSVLDEEDDGGSIYGENAPAPFIPEEMQKDDEVEEDDAVMKNVEPSALGVPNSSRRRKSVAITPLTPVPTMKPSVDPPKELPVDPEDSISKTPLGATETSDVPKKRKHTTTPHVLPTPIAAASTFADGDKNTLLKSDSAQISTDLANAVSSHVSVPSSRRTKSLGSTLVAPLSSISPGIQTDVPKDAVDSGFIDESGNPVIIQVNPDDGFWKCPLNDCRKNFRKDSLLKMHFKHYHPELKVTRGIANVVQMAQARTAFENEHPSDHHAWQKLPSIDTAAENSSAAAVMETSTVVAEEPPTSPHKRASYKCAGLPKESSEKGTTNNTVTPESHPPSNTIDSRENKGSQEFSSTALTQPTRLRVNRKRKFVIAKLGRVRSSKNVELDKALQPPSKSRETSPKRVIATDESCHKKSKLSEINNVSHRNEIKSLPTFASKLSSRSESPLKYDKRSDHLGENNFAVCAGNEPFLVPPLYESETHPLEVGNRPSREPWSKSHIRRSLLNSNRRRVGPNKLPNSTSIFLKRRMQMRKYNKRSKQKKTSILNRISSGRMRVISKSLNQRSLRKKRLRAVRRFRDVKVDVINCICNNKTEFGLMIQCEFCFCWQHGSCFNVQSNSQLPEYYACQSCSEPDKPRRSLPYEWAQSEFFRLGKLPSFSFAPPFPKEDAWIMKRCNKLTSKIVEAYSMIQNLQLNERICFGYPELSQLYQWNTEHPPPNELVQKERFRKYFKPVLRRLLIENKSDPTYYQKLKKISEIRHKLKKYSDSVESARLTMKKKLGCRTAAYVQYICDNLFPDMVKKGRKGTFDGTTMGSTTMPEAVDSRNKLNAEQSFQRLAKFKDDVIKAQVNEAINNTLAAASTSGVATTSSNPQFPASSSLLKSSIHSSVSSNGLKKGLPTTVRDAALLTTYLRETRTLEETISTTITRMSTMFPDDWKNLMKTAREFVNDTESEKFQWVAELVQTYNTLRVLLKNIYSESNEQKLRTIMTTFQRASVKLFDLFGIGVAEEHLTKKARSSRKRQSKRIRSLETFEMLDVAATTNLLMKASSKADAEEARKELFKKLETPSKPLSNEDIEKVMKIAEETKDIDSKPIFSNVEAENGNVPNLPTSDNNLIESHPSFSSPYFECRRLDGRLNFDFTNKVQLCEAAAEIPDDELTEVDVDLKRVIHVSSENSIPSNCSGILPVPASSRITPEICKRHLARDIMLQQQQIDRYLDKIEGQIIRLSSQSRQSSTVSTMSVSEMSSEREQMVQSLDLVALLSKTLIGDNDVVEPEEDLDASEPEAAYSDLSGWDSSSDSDDGDNISNFTGTDTETADEGGKSGDELLDI